LFSSLAEAAGTAGDAGFRPQAACRQIADAAQPLYDSLDDRQRHRRVQFVRKHLKAKVMDDRRDRRH